MSLQIFSDNTPVFICIMIDNKVHKHNTLKVTSVPLRNVSICVRVNMLTNLTSPTRAKKRNYWRRGDWSEGWSTGWA